MQADTLRALHDFSLFSADSENHSLHLVQIKLATESQRSEGPAMTGPGSGLS